jgi:hypothetical protein
MKFLMSTLLILLLSSIAMASCPADQSKAVRLSIAYLSLLENNGGSLLEGPTDGRTMDQICADLESSLVRPSVVHPGYQEIVLNLNNETCTMDVQTQADGRVTHNTDMSCEPK